MLKKWPQGLIRQSERCSMSKTAAWPQAMITRCVVPASQPSTLLPGKVVAWHGCKFACKYPNRPTPRAIPKPGLNYEKKTSSHPVTPSTMVHGQQLKYQRPCHCLDDDDDDDGDEPPNNPRPRARTIQVGAPTLPYLSLASPDHRPTAQIAFICFAT